MSDPSPALSVLDLVPVRSDQSTADALAATRRLARVADELGFRRYWLAEHHNMPAVAATNPPVLVAMVAAATERIRVGSGGVMLPNHAPLVVAEQFALLEAAHPGRIDLGIGRAPGTDPVTAWALRHGGGGVEDDAVARFPEYVETITAMLSPDGVGLRLASGHPRAAGDTAGDLGPGRLAARLVGLLGPARRRKGAALRVRPPLLRPGHRRGTGAVPQRVPALGRPLRAADLPHRQRRRGRDPGGGRPARAAEPALDGGPAHRAAAARPAARRGRRGAAGSTSPPATSPGRCWTGGWSARRRPRRSRCASWPPASGSTR